MTSESVLDLFRSTGALLEGHFRLTSGLAQQRLHAVRARAAASGACRSARTSAGRRACAGSASIVVLSPALGGLIIGHEVARGLGVRAIFAERQEGGLTLRRGFAIEPGERVLIVEDVVTTGGSTRETMEVAREAGGEVVGAAAIINRGGGIELGVPFHALATVAFPTWPEHEIPDWLAAIPVTKPGSRKYEGHRRTDASSASANRAGAPGAGGARSARAPAGRNRETSRRRRPSHRPRVQVRTSGWRPRATPATREPAPAPRARRSRSAHGSRRHAAA